MIKREELTNPASCMSRACDDEMTFVLLGRDIAAPAAIRHWIAERVWLGKNKPNDPQILEAYRCAETMEAAMKAPVQSREKQQGGSTVSGAQGQERKRDVETDS